MPFVNPRSQSISVKASSVWISLRQILRSLLLRRRYVLPSNSIKFNSSGGTITSRFGGPYEFSVFRSVPKTRKSLPPPDVGMVII